MERYDLDKNENSNGYQHWHIERQRPAGRQNSYGEPMNKTLYSSVIALLVLPALAQAQQTWQIHEWGTFTALQDESGQAIGGINTDDEPVPDFVHGARLAIQPHSGLPSGIGGKGIAFCHPGVTMRLETPVIYFHPPPGAAAGQDADVKVQFRGGWLTEFYPNAESDAPGQTPNDVFNFSLHPLNSDTLGHLEWDHLQIGGDWPLTNTTAHVWTSPRDVQAALVQNTDGESEKFLFYRGVGHMDAPLKVSYSSDGSELMFRSQLEGLPADMPPRINAMWLVDIRPDGEIAFRALGPVTLTRDSENLLLRTTASFAENEYSTANFIKLKDELKAELVSDGLYNDEAQALLKTWEVSYFKSPGTRVFFLCPRAWTDYYLPLQISLPAQINRVMVGRIELVTPQQRAMLRKLAAFSPAAINEQGLKWAGLRGTPLNHTPETYQTYLDLGRFRNALVLDEEKKRPTPGLADFLSLYHLQPIQLPIPVAAKN